MLLPVILDAEAHSLALCILLWWPYELSKGFSTFFPEVMVWALLFPLGSYRAPSRVPYRVGAAVADRWTALLPSLLSGFGLAWLGLAGLGFGWLLLGFRLDFGLDFGWILASA